MVKRAESLGATFADLRLYDVETLSILVTESQRQVSSLGREVGGSLRVLLNGNWGYSHFTDPSMDNVDLAVRSAFGDEKVNIVMLPPVKKSVEIKQEKPLNKSPLEVAQDMEKLKGEILSSEPRAKNVNVRFNMLKLHKEYYSNEDREIVTDYSLMSVSVGVTAREGDIIASARVSTSTFLGYPLEVFNVNEMILNTLKRRISNQLRGKPPKGGEHEVILAPDVVGVFSHEALGHLAEADLAVNGILGNLRGKKIAQDYVTVVDSGRAVGPMAQGITEFDDEGIEARDVKIVDSGVVSEFLVDRYYSAYLGQRPTGNGRAEDFRHPVLIRMRNTFMLPGDWGKDELIREVKHGYLLVSPLGGQTSPDGTFQFGIQEGYVIEDGEVTEPLRNTGISGYTLETLTKITGVSKDFDMWPGYCGKGGQSVPVGTGGPFIKVKVKVGGVE
ncbi:TldD/PmbA family protein [Metallosphaera tengchongensis]|uniref:TldD/PmbA family protein n=1 Tax=Metallosphaera tengchongensis TaxID=1532350 RepID=A0A6N0NVV5_9CREN|nr:TldD/PmbA family protein [Metallosphaera tengchongensis]